MTRRLSVVFAVLSAVPGLMFGQAPEAPANPISASHAKMYTMLSGVVIAAAEKVPEETYSFKPAPDVRTFGQLVGHLADSQTYFCALAVGDTKTPPGAEKTKTAKADLIAALKDAVAYCTTVYAGMTDAKGGESVKLMNMDFARLTVLAANIAHDYEHYGNMSTYMRMKGIVPPSSEKQAGPPQK